MRYGKGLVQVQVAYVSSNTARTGQSDLRVHVGTVHINHAAVSMYNISHFNDGLFKDTMCRGICYHRCTQPVTVLGCFFPQVLNAYIPALIAFNNNHSHAGHGSTGGIRAMG